MARTAAIARHGGADQAVPEAITRSTLRQYRHSAPVTEPYEVPGRGHSPAIDHGWREVADECLAWLAKQGR